jgi:hypothetical protein
MSVPGAGPVIAVAEAHVVTTGDTVECRPAPTLVEVADGAEGVALRWAAGPVRFEGFGFAKARGELSEDAFAGNLRTASVAVADGASSSWQAGEWALHLSRAWIADGGGWDGNGHAARIAEACEAFHRSDDPVGSSTTQWFADEVARRGAFAAFLGVAFSVTDGRSVPYRALSVGDVCLIQYRHDRLLQSFPVKAASELGTQPELIASSPGSRTNVPDRFESVLERGDVLLLVTDGVAAGLLREEVAADLVQALLHGGAGRIREALQAAKIAGHLPDDDYTLVRATI